MEGTGEEVADGDPSCARGWEGGEEEHGQLQLLRIRPGDVKEEVLQSLSEWVQQQLGQSVRAARSRQAH